MKRVLSLLLILTFSLILSVPAFADIITDEPALIRSRPISLVPAFLIVIIVIITAAIIRKRKK